MDTDDKILLDSEKANIRMTGGCVVQTIPKRWKRRPDLRAFFESELEIALVRENGQVHLEIRRIPKEETQ